MPRLTRRLIAATEPGPREIILRDDLPGFHVRVSPGGAKTYALYYRTRTRRERRLKIGRFEELTPERARDIARDALEAVRRGGDPAADRDADRAPHESYEAAVEDYVTREQVGRKGNATAPEVKRALLRDGWGRTPVREITAAEIRRRLEAGRTTREGPAVHGEPPLRLPADLLPLVRRARHRQGPGLAHARPETALERRGATGAGLLGRRAPRPVAGR